MNGARFRFLLAAVLFGVWIIYLGSLALATRHPVTLSRAQFLVSSLDVISDVAVDPARPGQPAAEVTVREIHWPTTAAPDLTGKTILVSNLGACLGWTGQAGPYILPLVRDGNSYRVVAVPPSPGFDAIQFRIYPDQADTRAQLRLIRKPTGE